MFVKSDSQIEERIVEELVASDEELRRQHELFQAEMAFKQQLINARHAKELTQKDVSRLSGLSQQAVSRVEKQAGGTIETLLRYLNSMGYTLSITRK